VLSIHKSKNIMKKLTVFISFTIMLFMLSLNGRAATTVVNTDNTDKVATNTTLTPEQKQARVAAITIRVNEIRAMDKSNLTRADKRALRAELRSLKAESNSNGGGIYLSVGAIIIIILLLILILH
jgi:hypothetical protein